MMKGIPASKGIGIAKAIVYREPENASAYIGKTITDNAVASETARYEAAEAAVADMLESTARKASKVLSEKDLQLFEAYKLLLDDPILREMVLENIKTGLLCTEASVLAAVESIQTMFRSLGNEYMRQRAEDVENVGNYLLDHLLGRKRIDLSNLDEDAILIARDLTPADTITLDKAHIKGFAIEKGGQTSHTAIMARTLEIPALVGCGEELMHICTGDLLILDGEAGFLLQNPEPQQLDAYAAKLADYMKKAEELRQLKDQPAETTDGVRVELAGNIAKPEEALLILEKGGDGVGLFRTEFLYLDRNTLPSEDEQFDAYKKAAQTLENKPCIIRTLDIGGDKQLDLLGLQKEDNPFLGYRAIRVCLKQTALFKTQLRAILRAGVYGNLQIMFPMISGPEELRAAKALLSEAKAELAARGIPHATDIKTGIMIEIPSAAMTADLLAKESDFFSIGTNDLCQYTLAVDRMNEQVSYLYNPLHPGVLRLIRNTIDAGRQAGIPVGMCGEMAANAESAAVLLGLGLNEFSMVPASIPYVKKLIRTLSFTRAKELADHVMTLESAQQIAEYVKENLYAQ